MSIPLSRDYSRLSLEEFSRETMCDGRRLCDCDKEKLLAAFYRYFKWSNKAIRDLESGWNLLDQLGES